MPSNVKSCIVVKRNPPIPGHHAGSYLPRDSLMLRPGRSFACLSLAPLQPPGMPVQDSQCLLNARVARRRNCVRSALLMRA